MRNPYSRQKRTKQADPEYLPRVVERKFKKIEMIYLITRDVAHQDDSQYENEMKEYN